MTEYGNKYNCLSFAPILHGCNGKIYDDGGGMFERFGDDIIDPAHHWYKLLSRTNNIIFQGVHDNKMISQKIIRVSRENCQCVLHHFRFRSFEEWVAKIKRGVAFNSPKNQHKLKEFFEFNRNLSTNNLDVISVMKRYDVTLQTLQSIPIIL